MNSMRVALITLEGGGTSTVCNGLAYNLSKKKIPTTIFTETAGKSTIEKRNDFLQIHRLSRFEIPPRCFWLQLQNYRFLLKTLKDYTLVHGVSPDASVLITHNKRKLKIPFVASFHAEPLAISKMFLKAPFSSWTAAETMHHLFGYPLHYYNIRRCINDADQIISCSYSSLSDFKANYKNLCLDKVSVIYNSVSFDEIENIEIDTQDEDGQSGTSIIFAGRLFWLKGQMLLLKAFEELSHEFKDLELKIFGKGPEEKRIRRVVYGAGLEKRVRIYGNVSHRKLIAELKMADLAVLPSRYEAQSLFMLEAMACKKPVVAFDIPSAGEIIKDGVNGILAKPFSVKNLTSKIRLILSDQSLQSKIGQNAYDYVKREHNWETQVEKYINVYKNVI